VIVYKVKNGNSDIEFSTQEEANYFIAQKGINSTVEQITKEIPIAQSTDIADVTPRQIRLALLGAGVTEAMIDSVINSLTSPTKEAAMIAWKYSTMFQRHNALIPVIAAMLNFNNQQLDQLWIVASSL
jgi:hypothetical protein